MEERPRSGRKKFVVWPLLMAGLVVLFQYCNSPKYTNPETGRAARVALSEGQEESLGLQSYQEVLANSRVIGDGPEVALVQRVMRRLVAGTGDVGRSMEWHVSVVDDPQANAFCLPGGKMVVFTGILPVAQTEAGLATVLGHEMAHATSRHGSQRLLRSQVANTLMAGAQASLALSDMDYQQRLAVMAAVGAGAKYGVILPFSRQHEMEADEIGLYYMARAGYDPRQAIAFWERMSEAGGERQAPEFASTHPSHGTRIERLQQHMSRAEQEYKRVSQHDSSAETGGDLIERPR